MTSRLKMQSNPFEKVLEKVMAICPAAVQDGKIDFDRLREELGDAALKDERESYDFTWVGKRAAIVEANKLTNKTLRPVQSESKNWETTENLYIKGDNLEVLKLLQESYLNKVKMIYIDPPYNTGKDFVYRDNFTQSKEDEAEGIGLFDEEGNKLFRNTETNGRFHSDWCSMMYPRLKVARDFLTDDGVIFISIDDNEVTNLRKICDEVFGESNFLYQLSVVHKLNGNDNSSGMMETQEYCLIYARDKDNFDMGVLPLESEDADEWEQDEIGYWKLGGSLKATGINAPREARPNLFFPIYINKETLEWSLEPLVGIGKELQYHLIPLTEGQEMSWYWSKSKFEQDRHDVIVKKVGDSYSLYKKQRPSLGDLPSKRGKTTFYSSNYSTANSNADVKKLFDGKKLFEYTKSMYLLKDLISLGNLKPNDIVMDFFSGSATTAHAVMQLNAEDGGRRKFIMVQLPEETDKDSEAFKAGYKTIPEIGKERIRRAGDKIVAGAGMLAAQSLDVGFRVLKLDESNMKDVFYNPSELKQADLLDSGDNIKADRDALDLLFGVMVDWGVALNLPIVEREIGKNKVYVVGDSDLAVCFDKNVAEETIRWIAHLTPTRVVFRDSSFEKDDAKINAMEIFKAICGWDDKETAQNVKVI